MSEEKKEGPLAALERLEALALAATDEGQVAFSSADARTVVALARAWVKEIEAGQRAIGALRRRLQVVERRHDAALGHLALLLEERRELVQTALAPG